MKECKRCRITSNDAPIHEHHIDGNHTNDSPENKICLCANCHMTLHWKRWKLSDIGMLDVEIKTHRYTTTTERLFNTDFPEECTHDCTRLKNTENKLQQSILNEQIEHQKFLSFKLFVYKILREEIHDVHLCNCVIRIIDTPKTVTPQELATKMSRGKA
jgi:hypothetical protein